MEFSIVCCETVIAGQRYGDDSSREFGGDCGKRDGGEESERHLLEVGHIEIGICTVQVRKQTAPFSSIWRSGVVSVMWTPFDDVDRQIFRSGSRIPTSYCIYCKFSVPSFLDVGDSY